MLFHCKHSNKHKNLFSSSVVSNLLPKDLLQEQANIYLPRLGVFDLIVSKRIKVNSRKILSYCEINRQIP
jgi:hypothetical protein